MPGRVTERAVAVADPDRRRTAFGVLVAQPKRRGRPGLLLEPRETDPPARALAAAGIRPRRQCPTEVDGGFLEHLLAHFGPPRQAVHPQFGDTIGVDTEDSAGRLGLLPHVERVDQIKPRPRHPGIRTGLALSELDLDDS